MRYEKGHKEQTRQRIVEMAARRFRKDGVDGVGLATVMSDAGLTNGAFYAHFDSKDALVKDVVDCTLQEREVALDEALEHGMDGVAAAIEDYLSRRHRDKPEVGCPTAALVAEIAR